jgi:hypothetical protein
MTPNGPEKRCANPNCRMPWPEDPAEDEDPEPVPKQALRDLMQKVPPLPARKVPVAQAAPKDILGLARQRLAEVKAELRRLDALQRERAELERMIAAARKVAG